nr:cytochrome P450 [Gordonia humi]
MPTVGTRLGARRGDPLARVVVATASDGDMGPLLREIRSDGPISFGRVGAVTVDHAAVKAILSTDDFIVARFGHDESLLGRIGTWAARGQLHPMEPPSLLVSNPPEHTRYRKLVTRVFTARAVERLRGQVTAIAGDLLDSLDPSDPVDLVRQYSGLLPVTVISAILGVPADERDRVLAFGEAAAPSLDMGLSWARFRSVEDTLAEFGEWLGEHLRRLADHPGDDLLSRLVEARDEGVGLSERELRATAGLVLAAGFETTVNLLSNGTALLSEHPDQLAALRHGGADWSNAVDEVLRFDPPVLLTARQAAVDTEVVGVPVREGQRILTVLAGANRDPQVFDDPDTFDVARPNASAHVSFGAGRHHCLGASLARMEGAIGLQSLFERFPDLALDDGAHRRETRILRGYEKLPVVLG